MKYAQVIMLIDQYSKIGNVKELSKLYNAILDSNDFILEEREDLLSFVDQAIKQTTETIEMMLNAGILSND